MQPLSLQNRCNARESCRAGQIAQLKMAKTLCKGDEKLYIPKYCCLSFSADYRQKGVFSFSVDYRWKGVFSFSVDYR